MKFRRTFLIMLAVGTLLVDFVYLVSISAIQGVASADAGIIHTGLILAGFGALAALRLGKPPQVRDAKPIAILIRIVIAAALLVGAAWGLQLYTGPLFETSGKQLVPLSMAAIITAYVVSITSGIIAVFIFNGISTLVFLKRRKTTKRNYQLLLILGAVYVALEYLVSPNGLAAFEETSIMILAPLLMVAAMLVNAFRFSWIVYLSRREKLIGLVLSFTGLVLSAVAFAILREGYGFYNALEYFNPALLAFIESVNLFALLYMIIGFISTLLHLPTAKEFDRKKMEISSFQNMGKLMTQVLDYDELLATSSQLSLDMSEADAAWIELLIRDDASPGDGASDPNAPMSSYVVPASLKNIKERDIREMTLEDGNAIQYLPIQTGKALVISDVATDRRIADRATLAKTFGSIALLPMRTHKGMVGLLCVAKRSNYEFDADMLNGLYAFADMVSIALENSKLIEQSIEKQRMEQELRIAQQMQRKLLPRTLPQSQNFELAAESHPAYEVGGDYYDILPMHDTHLGFIVGDVSGKGASAALYMAQVKGIFQSLGTHIREPGALLRKMNATLCRNSDKKYFVSVLYGMLDTERGVIRFSRAGHCPLLHISNDSAAYLKPRGMGLGLNDSKPFERSIEEMEVVLAPGDVIVLYTDGITEAKNSSGEEYETERLAAVVQAARDSSAGDISAHILNDVRQFAGSVEPHDDMTLLVLKWRGNGANEHVIV